MAEIEWDALNCAILRALLKDGRLSQVELAERIPLSATAIARRIRGLEEQGVIQGYQARINRQALGLSMMVVVHVGLNSQNEDVLKAFEEAAASAPSIVSCHLMSGETTISSRSWRAISQTSSAFRRSSSRGFRASRG